MNRRTVVTLLLTLILNCIVLAQTPQAVGISIFLTDKSGPPPVGLIVPMVDMSLPATSEDRRLYFRVTKSALMPAGKEDDYVEIAFLKSTGDSISLLDMGLLSIDIVIDNNVTTTTLANGDLNNNTYHLELSSIHGAMNQQIIHIRLNYSDDGKKKYYVKAGDDWYFKYYNNWTFYGAFGTNTAGFWAPTNIYSSNFHASSSGLTFASLPVGLAWGGKYNLPNSPFYFGASFFANYTILKSNDQSNVTFTGYSVGALLDFGNFLAAGVAYQQDWTGTIKSGWSIVFGISPGLLNLIKTAK